jgi:hypothetical protein
MRSLRDLAAIPFRAPALVVVLGLASSSLHAFPQEPQDQTTLQELRKAKLAKPVFKAAAWFTDYDKARERARKDRKFLLAYFTRSYAH